ncbi:MAG: hypothetical protein WBB60_15335 [Nitrospira sp.]|nr:hypothetical protein [Nitrospira sp.]HQY57659.1 hypothetical protein [Nitrospira sp.]HRA96999.1 hypothetical protein [Nitrospira sp.]
MLLRIANHCRRDTFCVLAGLLLWACVSDVAAQVTDKDEASLVGLISNFSRLRSIAYNEVRDLKAMHKQSKPNLAVSEKLYGKAKTAADTWLDTIRISLTTNGRLDSKVVAARGKELQAQIDALVEFAQASRAASSPHEKRKNPALIAAIAAIVAPVTDAAIKVFNVWSHADDKQRDEIREELKLLRWANFLEI